MDVETVGAEVERAGMEVEEEEAVAGKGYCV